MDRDRHFRGYVPAFRDVPDWRPVYRRDRSGDDGRVVRETIWGTRRDPRERLLVTVTETATAEAARSVVDDAVRNKSVQPKRGPDRFGPWSFVSPGDQIYSVNFAWENLAIRVFSCGGRQSPVDGWVDRILDELRRHP